MIKLIVNYGLIILIASGMLFVPITANADVFSVCQNGAASSSTLCSQAQSKSQSNPLTGPKGLLLVVSSVIASVAGLAAVIVIIIAGLRLITSGGEPSKTQGAKGALINALIGLVIIALAYTIVSFVLSRL